MRIAHMTAEHVPQVAALEKVCFSDPWSEKSVASELENPLSCWLVALDGGTVAGYVGSQTVMDETDMMNIAVHPDSRRQGVARALILALIGELKKRGSRCLTLEVRASNEAAIAFYRKNGFSVIGFDLYAYSNTDPERHEVRIEMGKKLHGPSVR